MRRQATPRNWELIIKFVRIIIPGKDEDEMPIHEFSVLEPRKEEINARLFLLKTQGMPAKSAAPVSQRSWFELQQA